MAANKTKVSYRGSNGADILPDDHAFGWWFSGPECIAKHGKRRKARVGATHLIQPHRWDQLEVGKFGFHASSSPLDALIFAPDVPRLIAWYVELSGTVKHDTDAMVGGRRRYLARVSADDVLLRYALACSLDVSKTADPDPDNIPDETMRMLERSDEFISVKKGAIGAGLMLPGKYAHWRLSNMLMNEVEWF